MKEYKSQSTVIPLEWDTESSPTTVYHNFNVIEIMEIQDFPQMYEYDVEEYTRAAYEEMNNELEEIPEEVVE